MPDPLEPPDPLDALLTDSSGRSRWDVDRQWSRLRAATTEPGARHRGRTTAIVVALSAAAAVVMWAVDRPRPIVAPPPAFREYTTARGMRAAVSLSDGSHVMLAPLSRLRVPVTFGTTSRRVELDGEAIFTVVHDTAAPFRVHAGRVDVVDVGTRFDVMAYDSLAISVAVVEGEVAVYARNGERDTSVAVRHGSAVTVRSTAISPERAIGGRLDWEEGRISFADRPLRDVIATVGRWYDLEIDVPDSTLLDRRITASFSADNPADVLDGLAAALGVRTRREGSRVTLERTRR